MPKIEFLDPSEAEKFNKQRRIEFLRTACMFRTKLLSDIYYNPLQERNYPAIKVQVGNFLQEISASYR